VTLKNIFWLLCVLGGLIVGAITGHALGYRTGHKQAALEAEAGRETLIAEVESLSALTQQQEVAIETAEASIAALVENVDDMQRGTAYEQRELELYRRIESGGLKRGIHADTVQLLASNSGPVLRVTLLQVGGRYKAKGNISMALIGSDLPNASNGRLVVADASRGNTIPFDFRFMTEITVPLPAGLTAPVNAEEKTPWMDQLDMLEIDLNFAESGRKSNRITVPANRMIVGPAE